MNQISKLFLLFAFLCLSYGVKGQEISPILVGNNLWYNPGQQIWDLTKDCGVKLIRIGGAEYDRNMPSTTTLLGWVKQIEEIGAIPLIQVSQYKDAASAAAVVQYFNKQNNGNKAPVKYWCIGNEPILQAGWPSASTFAAKVEAYYKPIASAMKAVDSTIIIYGPDECDYNGYYDDLFGGKNDISGKVPGHTYYYCDGMSWHRYPQGSGDPATEGAADMLDRIKKAKAKVDFVNQLHNRTGKDAMQWAIGEYNSKGGPEVHTFGNGQMFGAVLGGCMKYGAVYAVTWSMFESGGNRQGSDFSYIDGSMKPRSSYWHMNFISKYFKGTYADGKSSDKNLTVFGSKNADTISVMIMNTGYGDPLEYSLHLNFDSVNTGVQLNIDAARSKSYRDIIVGRSTQVIVFAGEKIFKHIYTSTDFDLGLPPTESEIQFATQAPQTPENLAGNVLSYKSIKLSWDTTSDIVSGYFIERKTASENTYKIAGFVNGGIYSFTDQNLNAESTYSYKLIAYNTSGKSDSSNSVTLTTLQAPAHQAYNGPHAIPGIIEAEDFDNNDDGIGYHDSEATNQGGKYRTDAGVDIEACTDINAGYNVGYISNGEWLDYSVANITAGTYDIAIRVASNTTATRTIKIYLGDTYLGSVTPPNTGGWQNWTTLYLRNIAISGGDNQILKLAFTGQDFNINWLQFGKDLGASIPGNKNEDFSSFYESSSKSIVIELPGITKKAIINITDISGRINQAVLKNNFLSGTIDVKGLKRGIYVLSVKSDRNFWSKKLLVY